MNQLRDALIAYKKWWEEKVQDGYSGDPLSHYAISAFLASPSARPFIDEGWVSVKTKLPEIDRFVMWYTKQGEHFIDCLDKDGNPWLHGVTHWQPITHPAPSPPSVNP